MSALTRTGALLLFPLVALACKPGDPASARIPSDSTVFYRTQATNLATISAEKDSLLRDLTETTRLITDVSAELATIKTPARPTTPVVGGEGTTTDERAEMLAKVRELTRRVRATENRLAAARRRVDSLTTTSDSLRTALASYANTITELQDIVESQKSTIQVLTDQVSSLMAQNVQLTQQKTVLEDTVSEMTARENEVYFVVGTKKELTDQGIIAQTGGTRFLIFTRTGESLVPARVLDPAQFTRADRRTLTEIPLPKADKEYRLVSRHDLAYAEATTMSTGGRFKGSLKITSPEAFWTASKFLIIVEN
jgi:hypothetical protein